MTCFSLGLQEDREKIKVLQVEVMEAKEKAAKAGPSAEDVSHYWMKVLVCHFNEICILYRRVA